MPLEGLLVITLEQDATMAEKARQNFQAAGLQKRIELLVCASSLGHSIVAKAHDFCGIELTFFLTPHCRKIVDFSHLLL